MHKEISFSIRGLSPLLMHSGRKLTNPLHPLTKKIKVFSGKRNKTEDDILALQKLEWLGGLYISEDPEVHVDGAKVNFVGGGKIVVPGEAIEATLRDGAKKNKLGTTFKSGVVILDDSILNYEGTTDLEEMWESGEYADTRNVKVQRAAIMRTRPIFRKWSLDFTAHYLPTVVDPGQIHEALSVAGMMVGLCDYRPKYGRFESV